MVEVFVVTTVVEEPHKKYLIVIPYVKAVLELIMIVFKSYKIPVFFKPTNTMQQLLVRLKDKVVKKRVVCHVYEIKCEDCEASYV